MSAQYWIETLQLEEHPEGGWFAESFRDEKKVCSQSRSASTAIYFLLEAGVSSHFHKIASAEMWHFYTVDPLIVHQLDIHGGYVTHTLGRDWEGGERFQAVVPAGVWFGAETLGRFSLVGCTVAPGFDFADFELAKRKQLCMDFPNHRELVMRLTR